MSERIVGPWDQGEDLVINGSHWNPRDVQISVRETADPVDDDEPMTTWANLAGTATDRTNDLLANPAGISAPEESLGFAEDRRKVMVVLGRNAKIGGELFNFLRSIDLRPLEWTQLVGAANSGART